MSEYDYYGEAVSRYPTVFKNKPIFDKYVKLLLSGITAIPGLTATNLNDVFGSLLNLRDVDTASGFMLDIIGEIVGEPRGTLPIAVVSNTYFVFLGGLSGNAFSSQTTPDEATRTIIGPPAGGIFVDANTINNAYQTWDDNTYRIFIKAKILRDMSQGTPEDILNTLRVLLNSNSVFIQESLDSATITIAFENPNNAIVQYLLTNLVKTILPIPIGVGVSYLSVETPFFAFNEVPNAGGFYDLSGTTSGGYGTSYGYSYGGGGAVGTTTVGGYFATIIT